jgi:hypothetical protein
MTNLSLYKLTDQYLQLAHQLADSDFDITTIEDTIESTGLTDDIATKCQSIEFVARGAESHNLTIDAEITRLQALKAHRSKVAQGLRDYIKTNMQRLEIERIECPLFQISIRNNPPAVDIFDPLSLPAEYMVLPVPKPPVAAPDKKAIAASIKAGVEVPGARLTQGSRLVIA